MGYLFFILSIHIVVFFSLSLTCFSLDKEKRGELENEENGGIKVIEMMPVESECTVVTLDENTEEENVKSLIKLNNCCSKKNVLNALKIVLTSFFVGGISYDSSLTCLLILKRSKKASIITSFVTIALLCVAFVVSSFVYKNVSCDGLLSAVLSPLIGFVVLYIFGDVWLYFLLKKVINGMIDESSFLFIVTTVIRLSSARYISICHPFLSICAINSADMYIWSSVILASCFSVFLFFCSIIAYYNNKNIFGEYIYRMSCFLISHAVVSFAQAETVLGMILFVLSKDKPMACICLSIVCYILISLSSFFHVKNETYFCQLYAEVSYRKAMELKENARLNEVDNSHNHDIDATPITEGDGVAKNVEQLSTASLH